MGAARVRRIAAAGAALVAAGLGAAAIAPGAEVPPDVRTPDGPATIRNGWLGAHTLEGNVPAVVVGWRVTVGEGGNAGPVRLRVLTADDDASVLGSGPVEQLPAAPGTYAFRFRPGIRYEYRSHDLALDQQVGGHAIVRTHPFDPSGGDDPDLLNPYVLDVFRPPLRDGARRVRFSERRKHQELALQGIVERDADRDRLGDETQDTGDLALLRARVVGWRRGMLELRARVRNTGTTVRHQPQIVLPRRSAGWGCAGGGRWGRCRGRPLRPGGEATVGLLLYGGKGTRAFAPARIRVGAEGPDTNRADNAGPLLPWLRLRAAAGGVRVDSSHRGRVRLEIRCAGWRDVRSARIGRAGRRVVPVRCAGRARVVATQRGARAVVRR